MQLARVTIHRDLKAAFPHLYEQAAQMVLPESRCGRCGRALGESTPVALQAARDRDSRGESVQFWGTHRNCRVSGISGGGPEGLAGETGYRAVEALLPAGDRMMPHVLVNPSLDASLFTRSFDGGAWQQPLVQAFERGGLVRYGQPLPGPMTGVLDDSLDTLRIVVPHGDWRIDAPHVDVLDAVRQAQGVLVVVLLTVSVAALAAANDVAAIERAVTNEPAYAGWLSTRQR